MDLIHQLQPNAVIFSDAGPDVRWIGDEAGVAGSTCWSLFNRTNAKIGDTDPLYSQEGDGFGQDWVPAECDVSIRPGWFWHALESPKPAVKLLDIYYDSVGRNCLFLLNVPPNTSGLISEQDIKVLEEFREMKKSIFSNNLARKATVVNSTSVRGDQSSQFGPENVLEEGLEKYWAPEEKQKEWELRFEFQEPVSFNVLEIQEPIQMGQRVASFHLEIQSIGSKKWESVVTGTTVGFKRLIRFPRVKSRSLKLVVDKARTDPLISYLGIYMDKFSDSSRGNSSKITITRTLKEEQEEQLHRIERKGGNFGKSEKALKMEAADQTVICELLAVDLSDYCYRVCSRCERVLPGDYNSGVSSSSSSSLCKFCNSKEPKLLYRILRLFSSVAQPMSSSTSPSSIL
ncbi:unnamed protein product [Thlaspi arvense]|uniref:Alpha-L-fucosidase n=1 Tax=Thlaspi arvense TaxID=13288 RepID=A0AAU9SAG7_THLAR|nr:unnamed protein product [Thlaspi arvense]